eukprot:3666640-Prymnesium_polylepis.1
MAFPCRVILGLLLLVAQSTALTLGSIAPSASSSVRCGAARMQMAPAPLKTKQKVTYKTSGGGGGGGKGGSAAQIAKPKRKAHTEDLPLFKVIMLSDEEYEEDPVCEVLMQVRPG